MDPTNAPAFTAYRDKIVHVLLTKASIGQPFSPQDSPPPKDPKEYIAIWDTGATNTVVTQKVVDECGLKPIGMAKVHTAGGAGTKPVYYLSLFLPNKVIIPQLTVIEGIITGQPEILIGMDIISKGDFAVTNKGGKTVFSFRMPSVEVIDFLKQQQGKHRLVTPASLGPNRATRRNAAKKTKKKKRS